MCIRDRPYSTRELLARVRAALRRSEVSVEDQPEPEEEGVLDEQGVRLDTERHTVSAVSYTHLDVYKRQHDLPLPRQEHQHVTRMLGQPHFHRAPRLYFQ